MKTKIRFFKFKKSNNSILISKISFRSNKRSKSEKLINKKISQKVSLQFREIKKKSPNLSNRFHLF